MSNIPVVLEEEVLSRVHVTTMKRVGSSWEKCNSLSKRKTKHVIMDLPKDLAEEVLSRIPMTSMRRVRSTCKTWNTLSRCESFAKKHLALNREFNTVVVMTDFKLCLTSINLDEESFMKPRGELISLDRDDRTEVSKVFHCDGLLLCLSRGENSIVVWNPYLGQTRWIDPEPNLHSLSCYSYALGYNRSTKSHKILRFYVGLSTPINADEFKINDLNSGSGGSWRVLDFDSTRYWKIDYDHQRGVSLKGNTYWFATARVRGGENFLICFDFTKERFGPRLPLPPSLICDPADTLTLSTVREEQLLLFFQQWRTLMLEIWITTKIDPNAVSWSNKLFLQVDMKPLTGYQFADASFFIDEEKKVAVIFNKDEDNIPYPTHKIAYIVGVDGSLKEVETGFGESTEMYCFPLVCPYVPSLVLLD